MKKRLVTLVFWSLLIIGLGFALHWVQTKELHQLGNKLEISIKQDQLNYFISEEDIRQFIRERGDTVRNQPLTSIQLAKLEGSLDNHPAIANAHVYHTIDGKVNVEIVQRMPIVRIIDAANESYYIDVQGRLMPLSDKYTANVPIVTAAVRLPYNLFYKNDYSRKFNPADTTNSLLIASIYEMAKYIWADEFWKSQIQQINLNTFAEFELIPRVGDHVILFGNAQDIDVKFSKLLIFYKQGLNPTGWWNKYSVINLKFKDQVVCTRKETTNN